MTWSLLRLLALGAALSPTLQENAPPPADLILVGARVYTLEESQPWASTVVVTGDRITAVLQGGRQAAEPFRGPRTRIVDLSGRLVLPGFIDSHIHFDQAGALINDANLLTVADDEGLRREMRRLAALLEEGEWITGGLWGAYEQWALGAAGAQGERRPRWEPTRFLIDEIVPRHPCLLSSFDGELFLANSAALAAAGLTGAPLPGMKTDAAHRIAGLVAKDSPALERLRASVRPKSHARLLQENRAALKRLAESGIVEVHDIVKPEQTVRFVELQERGELTCRVWLRPDLSRAEELRSQGLRPGLHPKTQKPDAWLRYGALKGYVDGIMGTHGALFFEPYSDQPGNFGHYRPHTSDDPELKVPNLAKLDRLLRIAAEAGFTANVHAIGDRGVALMLDAYERLARDLGRDLEGYRVIHAQVVRSQDLPRFRQLNTIAEVNPYHVADDMRWMEERIGHERCKGAYAFRSLIDHGATLCFGSDWPGTSAAEYHVHPKYLIHAAVNRTTLKGAPPGGWFPEQRISVAEALQAYTINGARAALEAKTRGSIKAGKLADLSVLDRNLLEIDPRDILDIQVDMTIVGGRIVFER